MSESLTFSVLSVLGRSSKKHGSPPPTPPRRVGGRAEACEVGYQKRTAGYRWKALRKAQLLSCRPELGPASCELAELIFVKRSALATHVF